MTNVLHTDDRLFPHVGVRNEVGAAISTPEIFSGRMNIVQLIDAHAENLDGPTWGPWVRESLREHEGLRFYEIFVHGEGLCGLNGDGCHSALALRSPTGSLGRRLEFVGDLRRMTQPLGIETLRTPWTLTVSFDGLVHQRESGPFEHDAALRLSDALKNGA